MGPASGIRRRPAGAGGTARVIAKAISVLLIVAGVGIVAYVNVVDWASRAAAERQVTELESRFVETPAAEQGRLVSQARLYNELLAARKPLSDVPYEEQLSVEGSDVMAFVEIPAISVKLPVRHGTSDAVLMQGAGHFEGSSLPVGGVPSRCVLMAHSGMRNAAMFDELYRVAVGDEVIVGCLGDELRYRVVSTEVAAPEDIESKIELDDGRDLVTLITCTPYGVNSERVVVNAERMERDAPAADVVRVSAPRIGGRQLAALAMAACIALYAAGFAIARIRRFRKR